MIGRAGGEIRAALRAQPRAVARIAAWSVVEAAPAFVIGYAIAKAIGGFAADRPGAGALWLAGLAAIWMVAALGARQVVLAVADVVEPFRDRLLTTTVTATLDRVSDGHTADTTTVARTNLQVELARDALAAVITVIRGFVFTLAGVTTGLSVLSPRTLALVLPPLVAGFTLFVLSLPARARRERAYLLADEATAQTAATVVGGLRDIVACGAQDRIRARLDARIAEQAGQARALARLTAVRTAALGLGGWLPVAALLIGTPWLLRGGMSGGAVIGSLAYVTQSLIPAFTGLVNGLGASGVRLTVALDRILEQPPPVPDVPRAAVPRDGRAELRGVRFAYAPYAEPVLAGLDLRIEDGEHLAIAGPSGIGKSTLAALITGTLQPTDGSVTVGGSPAHLLDPATRVLIPQEAYVFRGTVAENLTYLAEAPLDVVQAAAASVGADELVQRLGGLGAELDPATLSAGERQLIALARAYLAPARLTVLDEATCHLDPAAEARAEQAFAARAGTLIVVAHRISSARRADRILLMDGPRTWLGTHAELLGAAPLYAELAGAWEYRLSSEGHDREGELSR